MKALTTKQRATMKIIMAGNVDVTGARVGNVDYHQILERLPYKTSRESLMCSLRILEQQGWIEKAGKVIRDGRSHMSVKPTEQAERLLDQRANQVGVKELKYLNAGDDDVVIMELV